MFSCPYIFALTDLASYTSEKYIGTYVASQNCISFGYFFLLTLSYSSKNFLFLTKKSHRRVKIFRNFLLFYSTVFYCLMQKF